MRRAAVIAVGLCLLAFVLGWWRAGSYVAPGTVDADEWASSQLGVEGGDVRTKAAATAQRVRATNLFLLTRQAEDAKAAATASGNAASNPDTPAEAPPFPKIVGGATLNGVNHVNLSLADGQIVTVKAGDSLPGGWVIKAVDLRQVIAVFNDTETRFAVRGYLDTAFDKPDDNTSEDMNTDPKLGGE